MSKQLRLLAITVFLIVAGFMLTLSIFQSTNSQNKKAEIQNKMETNFKEYEKIIITDPVWYQNPKLKPKLDQYFREPEEGKSTDFIKEKRAFIQMVGNLLADGKVKLGKPIENFDKGRLRVDTVVIHHTETAENANLNYINGIHLFTLYVIPAFDDPKNSVYGKPVFSGHYDDLGHQVFYGYHYIVKPDGTITHVLKDEYIGYHARGVNSNSIGISLIGNYNNKKPSAATIKSIKRILASYPEKRVVGHREVTPDTDCPGDTFFGENGWKKEITRELGKD